jgi:thiamine-phosphate diphosphorylase
LNPHSIPRLCYWTDGARGRGDRDALDVIERLARGGVEAVVLRERDWSIGEWRGCVERLAPLRARGLRVLAGRRLDLCRALGLDGVHLGAEAIPVADARAFLGPDALVGYSAHDPEEARAAAKAGASYVSLSPIYPTGSKPDAPARGAAWLARSVSGLTIPALALGGVTPERVPELHAAGAHGVVAIAALGAAADPEAAAREFRRALADERAR